VRQTRTSTYDNPSAAKIFLFDFQLEITRTVGVSRGSVRQTRTRSVNREERIFPEVELDREDPVTRSSATTKEEEQERLTPRLLRGRASCHRAFVVQFRRRRASKVELRKCPKMSHDVTSAAIVSTRRLEKQTQSKPRRQVKNLRRELETGIDVVGSRAWATEQTHWGKWRAEESSMKAAFG
jgi:hypothetical protein